MADFKTTLSDPNTGFTQVKPRQAPDQAREQFASGVASLAYAGGKGYAKGAASDQLGAGVTLEQANQEAQQIEKSIETALTAEQELIGSPLNEQRIAEIKDRELSAFRANDRTLLALRDRGTLSTKEIDARRRMNLQDKLSNPLLAMFRGDFLDAAGDLTGGSQGAGKSYFGYTPEEQAALAVSEEKAKAAAEHEGDVQRLVSIGIPEKQARVQLLEQAETERKVQKYEAIKAERQLNTFEFEDHTRELQNKATRGITTDIYYINSINGDAGLNPQDMMQMKTRVANSYLTQQQEINSNKNIGEDARKAAHASLDLWKTGMDNYLKAWSLGDMKKEQIDYIKNEVMVQNFKEFPWLFGMSQMFPDIGQVVFEAKGQVEGRMQMMLGGEEAWAKYKQNIAGIYSDMTKFAQGDPTANPNTIAAFNTPEAFEALQQEADKNPSVRQKILDAYDEVPEVSLRNYNQVFSPQYAEKNPAFKNEVDLAMRFAKEKLIRKAGITGNDATKIEVKTAPPSYADSMVGRKEQLIIRMPANMEQYRGDMEQMYKTIDNHRWAWKNVSDKYATAADAFNGWMRGEWEFDLGLEEGVGKVQPERTPARQELKAPAAPTEADEAALADQLEQRVAIRDRDRTVERAQGTPVSPIPEVPEKQPFQTTGKFSTDVGNFTTVKDAIANVETAHGAGSEEAYNQPPNKGGYEGKYQFRYRDERDAGYDIALALGIDPKAPKTPEQQEAIMDEYLRRNALRIEARGHEVTPYNLWLYHNQGPGGANAILTGKLTETIRRNIRNQGVKGDTDEELIENYHKKFKPKFESQA